MEGKFTGMGIWQEVHRWSPCPEGLVGVSQILGAGSDQVRDRIFMTIYEGLGREGECVIKHFVQILDIMFNIFFKKHPMHPGLG